MSDALQTVTSRAVKIFLVLTERALRRAAIVCSITSSERQVMVTNQCTR